MSFTGTYVLEDLVSGAWLHVRPRLAMAGALAALLLFSLLSAVSVSDEAGVPVWAVWVVTIGLLYLALLVFLAIPRRCKRELAQRKDFQRELTLSASEAGLGITTAVIASLRPWSDYSRWKEGQKVFLLYQSDNFFQVVPKRFFASNSELEAFRELLKRGLPPRAA